MVRRAFPGMKKMTVTSVERNDQLSPTREVPPSRSAIVTFVVLAIWLALVVFTTTRHEYLA